MLHEPIPAHHRECHHCGCWHELDPIEPGMSVSCDRCGSPLIDLKKNWWANATAWLIAAAVFFVLTNSLPFISLEAAGVRHSAVLLSGVLSLWDSGHPVLASLVFLNTFLLPLVELTLLSTALAACKTSALRSWGRRALRVLRKVRPWNMLEIFLISVLVTSIKLADLAELVPGPGLLAFAALVVTLIAANRLFSSDKCWQILHSASPCSRGHCSCHCCGAAVMAPDEKYCPRCRSATHHRTPQSIQNSLALVIAATVLYIPANLLPIMSTSSLGREQSDTIWSGVVHLMEAGSWPIALVVFVASLVVPIAKLVIMYYLLWSTRPSAPEQGIDQLRKKTHMFRLTELVGRWSMVDIFVVTLLVTLVQFGLLAEIAPEQGALAFALVVVLTMLAAESFDARLIWDRQKPIGDPT